MFFYRRYVFDLSRHPSLTCIIALIHSLEYSTKYMQGWRWGAGYNFFIVYL